MCVLLSALGERERNYAVIYAVSLSEKKLYAESEEKLYAERPERGMNTDAQARTNLSACM